MQAEKLLMLIQNPHHIVPEDVQKLQNLLQTYPYLQIAYALLAKAAYDKNSSLADPNVQLAAVYATDRPHFKTLLTRKLPLAAAVEAPKSTLATMQQVIKRAPVHNPIKSIQQNKRHVTTRKSSRTQLDKIQASLQRNAAYKLPSLQTSPETGQVDLTNKSTTFHDDLATETLAQILWQQGKLQNALAMYEKLLLKFPEKKDYFASTIKKLKIQVSCSHC